MRTIIATLGAAALLAGPAPGAAADGHWPQILDQASDANGINGQWYDQALLGQLVEIARDLAFGGDPFGEGRPTPVGSYAPADLREGRLATDYVAVPVGGNGIDYRVTGLSVTLRTEEPFVAQAGTGSASVQLMMKMGAPELADPCTASWRVTSSEVGALSTIRWYRYADCAGGLFAGTHAAWQATRSADGKSITMRIPLSSLGDAPEAVYLQEDAYIYSVQAVTQARDLFTYDVTQRGAEFFIGQDMPEDVPCTEDCP